MTPPDGERLATMETKLDSVLEKLGDASTEQGRTRERLHRLENTTAALVQQNTARTAKEQRDRARNDSRLRELALVVGVVGILIPLLERLFL